MGRSFPYLAAHNIGSGFTPKVNTSEEDLVIAYRDGDNWIMLPSTVNTIANTVAAEVTHFTPFAILAKLPPAPPPPPPPPAPAAFATTNLSITPAEVDIGETVTISVLVTNTGDAAGSYEVTLKIYNVVVATEEVTLAGGASQTVTFTTAKDVAGTYVVNVNGLTGTFVVKAPIVPTPPVKPINWWYHWWLYSYRGGYLANSLPSQKNLKS